MVNAQPKPIEDHAVHSDRLIRHAWEQLEQGDRLQASEKAWGAVAHALKDIAARRGWRNRAHTHNEVIAVHLAKLSGDERIFPLYQTAEMLHRNYYEDWKGEAALRMGLESVAELLPRLAGADRLIGLAPPAPDYSEQPRARPRPPP